MNKAIEDAHKLCSAGSFDEALPLFKALEASSVNASEKAGFAVDQATCNWELGRFEEARACVARAKALTIGDLEASIQVDFYAATLLIKEGFREQAAEELKDLLNQHAGWLASKAGRNLYEEIQTQRAFTLMHILQYRDARPILEEVVGFPMDNEVKSAAHCHLGRCYFELGEDRLAYSQFFAASKLGVLEDWDANFHFHFGYTLYNLKEFPQAKRQFILCLQSNSPGPPISLRYEMLAATSRKLGERDEARHFDKMSKS